MSSLLQKLDQAYSRSTDPDNVVRGLSPFAEWRLGRDIPRDELVENIGRRIVVLYYDGHSPREVETEHLIGRRAGLNYENRIPAWGPDMFSGGTFARYWIRSLESFEANPHESPSET